MRGMSRPAPPAALLAAALLLASCAARVESLGPCRDEGGGALLCGVVNPEDMAPLPGEEWLVVSEMASRDDAAGSLVALRPEGLARRALYPPTGAAPSPEATATPGWGSPRCTAPPDPAAFRPHGIDVSAHGPGGAPALAVVHHGSRESVELFEIGGSAEPSLVWRGCVPLPAGVFANDVAFLPGGGFVVTNMMPSPSGLAGVLAGARIALGLRTGNVLAWTAQTGLSALPDGGGSAPNGIAVSADGRDVFFAEWAASRLVRLRQGAGGGLERASVDLPTHPDNLSWARDGRLLVTGQDAGLFGVLGCSKVEVGTCDVPYSVLAVEPESLAWKPLASGRGAGTVALEVGSQLWVGTYRGDRIVRLPSAG
jgi:hypothetical protein